MSNERHINELFETPKDEKHSQDEYNTFSAGRDGFKASQRALEQIQAASSLDNLPPLLSYF